ncbi:Polyphenol oxidase, chloroplastic [Linum grandiflorum]
MASFLPSAAAAATSFRRRHRFHTLQNRQHSSTAISCNNPNRRGILLGAGLYGATALTRSPPKTLSEPIPAPDPNQCGPADFPEGATPTDCCPPRTTSIKDFTPPMSDQPPRVRPAAHLVDEAYVEKYNRAVELMKALPEDDPRSFVQQANVHCAYCGGAYPQVGFPDVEVQIHYCWLFFPWHRFYLYFHERILAKLIDDPTFMLPFWNWDAPAGMQLPSIYTDPNSSLYDPFRDPNHQPPTLVDLDYSGEDQTISSEDQIADNLIIMYRAMVSGGKTATLFLGNPYRAGDPPNTGSGSVETTPHGPVHLWTGDNRRPNREDMGNFYSLGRDPIFFAHHGNIDRLWNVWKTLGGKMRADFDSVDWLDSAFLFYDENAEPVRVRVRDCLDSAKQLGYVYQDVDLPWIGSKPRPPVKNVRKDVANVFMTPFGERSAKATDSDTTSFPATLNSEKVSVKVNRTKKSRTKEEKEVEEEVLVVEGIVIDVKKFVKFDVYMNDEDDVTPLGPGSAKCAGCYVNVPHGTRGGGDGKVKTNVRFGITDMLDDLDADGDDSVIVSLVPRFGVATVDGVKIEFLRG